MSAPANSGDSDMATEEHFILTSYLKSPSTPRPFLHSFNSMVVYDQRSGQSKDNPPQNQQQHEEDRVEPLPYLAGESALLKQPLTPAAPPFSRTNPYAGISQRYMSGNFRRTKVWETLGILPIIIIDSNRWRALERSDEMFNIWRTKCLSDRSYLSVVGIIWFMENKAPFPQIFLYGIFSADPFILDFVSPCFLTLWPCWDLHCQTLLLFFFFLHLGSATNSSFSILLFLRFI